MIVCVHFNFLSLKFYVAKMSPKLVFYHILPGIPSYILLNVCNNMLDKYLLLCTRCIKYLVLMSSHLIGIWCCVIPGVSLAELPTKSAVRTCGFSYSGNMIMYSTDRTMGQECTVSIYDIRDDSQMRKFHTYCFN